MIISLAAIYYSVSGLMAIFAGASVAIMIMGTILEIGKLVTVVWLHYFWNESPWWLKGYLSVAVIVLMLLTSMGIFGGLSKAHIEQTANVQQSVAQIQQINSEINKQEQIITRSETTIKETLNKDNNRDAELQAQINIEQARIDSAYARIQPAINEQQRIIEQDQSTLNGRVGPLQAEVDSITALLSDLQDSLANDDIKRAQSIVGTPVDGVYGSNTASAVEDFRASQIQRRDTLLSNIPNIRNEPRAIVEQARNEIARLRTIAETQIADSNELISRLRSQLGQGDADQVYAIVEEKTAVGEQARVNVAELTKEKFELESKYRQLEAEVGPIKYIAEFVYGDSSNQDLLEEAVRWVIILIIFVFDPLAVLLLIASQHTFEIVRRQKVNPLAQCKQDGVEQQHLLDKKIKDDLKIPTTTNQDVGQNRKQSNEQVSSRPNNEQSDTSDYSQGNTCNSSIAGNSNNIKSNGIGAADSRRNDTVGMDVQRQQELEIKENNETYRNNKQQWKLKNPDQTIKFWKDEYINGKIDKLPWDNDIQIDNL